MKYLFVIAFILSPLVARAETTALSLPELLKQVPDRNPDVRAAFEKWNVSEKEARAAGVWPNPMVTYIDEKDPTGQVGMEPMTRKHYNVSQEVPFPGKLSNEARMKHHEALIAQAKYEDALLEALRNVKIAYHQLASADRRIAFAKQNAESMRRTLGSTQSRLAANQAMASDSFMAQMELRRMENMVFEKEQQRREIEIELNTLLDEPLEKTWPAPPAGDRIDDVPFTLKQLQTMAENHNPHYREAHHEVEHSGAMLWRSRLEYAPDLGFMYEYQTAGNGGGVGEAGRQLGISLSVPLWMKRAWNQSASAKAHMLEAESMARGMTNMVRKMVAMEYVELNMHLTLAKKIQTEVLPAAQAALNSTRDQYAAGRGDFLRLLEASRAWVDAHVEHENEVYHTYEHWSELERWVGTDLSPKEKETHNEK